MVSKKSVTDRVEELKTRGRAYRRHGLRTAGVALAFNAMAGVAAAQGGGDAICGTPIADGITQTAQLIIGLIVLGCIIVAGLAEGISRFQRDPQDEADSKDWRNGAAIGAVSAPILIWLVIQVAGFFSIPVVSCVDLVPFL